VSGPQGPVGPAGIATAAHTVNRLQRLKPTVEVSLHETVVLGFANSCLHA
jgi:hypothetical protein